jgi:hypothetical protein
VKLVGENELESEYVMYEFAPAPAVSLLKLIACPVLPVTYVGALVKLPLVVENVGASPVMVSTFDD